MTDDLEGGCACAAVRYRLASPPIFVHCCHCRDCQRQTGSAFVINALIETDRIKQQVMGLFQAAQDAGEIRTDIPVTVLVSLYMGMLRESKGLQGLPQTPHLVTVLLDGEKAPGPAPVFA